jgi:predicted transcriptional regulator
MPAIAEELDQFTRYVRERLISNSADLSLEECLREWRAAQEEAETIAAIQRGLDDIAAGRYMTIEDADGYVRSQLAKRWENR